MIILGVLFLSFLIVIHELGHFLAARFFNLRVDEFGIGFPPRIFSRKKKETRYSLNLLPLGGFVKIHGESGPGDEKPEEPERSFYHQRASKRAVIIAAGVVMNFLAGWLVLSIVFSLGLPKAILVTEVSADSPAAIAQIKEGDVIVGEYESLESFIGFVNENKGRELTLTFLRDGGEFTETLVPRISPPEGEGALGVGLVEVGAERQGILKSFIEGGKAAVAITGEIFSVLFRLVSGAVVGDFEPFSSVAGPVGIFAVLGHAGKLGGVYFLQLLGLISLNLAVLNIMPFPALDGGRLLFIGIEKIKGSPVNRKIENWVNAVGFSLLILLLILITIRDIARIL